MIVRGLRGGQVLREVFRIEQQSPGHDFWMQVARIREQRGSNSYKTTCPRVEIALDKEYLLWYRIKCIKARRIAGPGIPSQADSTATVRTA